MFTDPEQSDAVIEAVKKKVDLVNWTESYKRQHDHLDIAVCKFRTILKEQATEQAMQIIESRINAFGVKEPTLAITRQREIPVKSCFKCRALMIRNVLKKLIGEASKLELMKIVSPPNPSPVQTYPTEEAAEQSIAGAPNRKVLEFVDRDDAAPNANSKSAEEKPKQWVVVETPAVVDGSELRDASAVTGHGKCKRISNFIFIQTCRSSEIWRMDRQEYRQLYGCCS